MSRELFKGLVVLIAVAISIAGLLGQLELVPIIAIAAILTIGYKFSKA